MDNSEIAAIFEEIADILEIQGDNPFRVRSYRNAARTLESISERLERMVAEERDLLSIPGIGEGIGKKIVEIVLTGDCNEHRRLLQQIPQSLLELLKIPGMGPKKVGLVYRQLGIETMDQLSQAAAEKRLRDLPGMGQKTEEKILKGIEDLKKTEGRSLLSTISATAEAFSAWLRQCPQVVQLEFAGSFRRRRETIGDLDILVTGPASAPIMERFIAFPGTTEVLAQGETKSSIRLQSGLQVDLRVLEADHYGAALQYFTGSQAHNIALRDRAKRRGLKVNEYGVFRLDSGEYLAGRSEEELYRALGLAFIPPELRENQGEIEAAESGTLPALVGEGDIRGDLHMHTQDSDGKCALEELVSCAEQMGYEYIAITDHSRSVYVARGLDEQRLLRQMSEIDRFNRQRRRPPFVLKGCEVDIRTDGSLDLDEEVLAKLDLVIAAVHSGMNMPVDEMTERIVSAFRRPCVKIFAHPTGRILKRREPYAVDMQRLVEAAAKHGVALEINAYPGRLDLSDVHCRLARSAGARLAIDTDTHSLDQLNNMRYGVYTARRGWLEKTDVLNALPLAALRKALTARSMNQTLNRCL
jgi:DNA polymerase (family X)